MSGDYRKRDAFTKPPQKDLARRQKIWISPPCTLVCVMSVEFPGWIVKSMLFATVVFTVAAAVSPAPVCAMAPEGPPDQLICPSPVPPEPVV